MHPNRTLLSCYHLNLIYDPPKKLFTMIVTKGFPRFTQFYPLKKRSINSTDYIFNKSDYAFRQILSSKRTVLTIMWNPSVLTHFHGYFSNNSLLKNTCENVTKIVMNSWNEPFSQHIYLNATATLSEWEQLHTLSERLASLGIMGEELRVPLKLFNTLVLWWFQRFQQGSQLIPHNTDRRQL